MAEIEASLEAAHRFSTAFLAFERMNGRTEEVYDKEKAKQELEQAVKSLAGLSLPKEQLAVYEGLREFRRYIGLEPTVATEKSATVVEPVESASTAETEAAKNTGVRAVMKKLRSFGMEP